jgi:hypothetical protein
MRTRGVAVVVDPLGVTAHTMMPSSSTPDRPTPRLVTG